MTRELKLVILPRTGHDGTEWEQVYSSTLPSTSALGWSRWSTPRPDGFTPGKTWYPLYRRLCGSQGRSGRVRKISPSPAFDPRTVKPVAGRYSDWVIPTTHLSLWFRSQTLIKAPKSERKPSQSLYDNCYCTSFSRIVLLWTDLATKIPTPSYIAELTNCRSKKGDLKCGWATPHSIQ